MTYDDSACSPSGNGYLSRTEREKHFHFVVTTWNMWIVKAISYRVFLAFCIFFIRRYVSILSFSQLRIWTAACNRA